MTDPTNAPKSGAGDDTPHTPTPDPVADGGRRDPGAEDLALVLESQRAEADGALTEQREKYLRLAAEFENFRKRSVREREHAEQHGQRIVVRGMLDALDDLARFAHVDPSTTDATIMVDGARIVEQKLLKSLAGHGLEVVNPVDQVFDPGVHEAVSTVPAQSEAEDHTVAQVYQVGYVFNGHLLRAARVVVRQWPG